MGGGIAQLVADQADVPVRLKDIQEAALAGGMQHASGLFKKMVDRRRLDRTAARRKMALLRPALDDSGLANVDLVIEAVVEKLPVKQAIFADLGGEDPGAGDPRVQHLVAVDRSHRRAVARPVADRRHALLQPGRQDAAGRGHRRRAHVAGGH